jgi:dipeptidyl aminopeptidase/acylaminoacyl peptidase
MFKKRISRILHSQRLHEAVVAGGGQMQLEVMAGEGHGFKNPANVTAEYRITEDFLNRLFTA